MQYHNTKYLHECNMSMHKYIKYLKKERKKINNNTNKDTSIKMAPKHNMQY